METKFALSQKIAVATAVLFTLARMWEDVDIQGAGVYIPSPNLISFRNNFTIEIEKINNFRGGQ